MKLELKHIVRHLPYGLKMTRSGKNFGILYALYNKYNKAELEFEFGNDRYDIEDLKPALRPISSMTKQEAYQLGLLITNKNEMEDKTVGIGKITVGEWEVPIINYTDTDGEEYNFMVMFCNHGISATNDNNITFEAYEWLYQHHFDIHGLIEQGLAIDINTL